MRLDLAVDVVPVIDNYDPIPAIFKFRALVLVLHLPLGLIIVWAIAKHANARNHRVHNKSLLPRRRRARDDTVLRLEAVVAAKGLGRCYLDVVAKGGEPCDEAAREVFVQFNPHSQLWNLQCHHTNLISTEGQILPTYA
jgi:hypothetical protein